MGTKDRRRGPERVLGRLSLDDVCPVLHSDDEISAT